MHLVIHAWRDLAHPQAGGSEQLVHHLAAGMSERGHRVHLICGGPIDERPYQVSDAGGTYSQYVRVPFIDRRLARDADVVLDIANGATYCTPLWRRRPTVLLVHHLHTEQWQQVFARPIAAAGSWFERRLVPRIYHRSLVIAISPSTALDLQRIGVPESQIRMVPIFLDSPPTEPPGIRSAQPLFVALGRLVPHKRVALLLAMWERVRPVSGGTLVIIGDGPERGRLEAMGARDVEFLGRVDESTKQRLLAEAWLLVHPASHEGWGIAITEAARHATPALGFDVPGVRDAVDDGATGRLAADDHEFVRLWIELAQEPSKIVRYGSAAQAQVAAVDADGTVSRFEEIALEAIEREDVRPSSREGRD